MTSRYFQYIISPTYNEIALFISLRIDNDTITAYYRKIPSVIFHMENPNLELDPYLTVKRHVDPCLLTYQREYAEKTGESVNFLQPNDFSHNRVHANIEEVDIRHMHALHPKKIDKQTLHSFLSSLKACETRQLLPENHTFFTETVAEQIKISYETYLQTDHYNNEAYITSNNPGYLMTSIPTVNEHQVKLIASDSAAILSEPVVSPSFNVSNAAVIGGLFAVGAAAVGLFSRCKRAPKHNETKKENQGYRP